MSTILLLNIFTGVIGLLYLPLAIGAISNFPNKQGLPVFISILIFLTVLSISIIILGALSNAKWRPSVFIAIFMVIAGVMSMLVIPIIGWAIGPLTIVSGTLEGSAAMDRHIVI